MKLNNVCLFVSIILHSEYITLWLIALHALMIKVSAE